MRGSESLQSYLTAAIAQKKSSLTDAIAQKLKIRLLQIGML